MKIEFNEFGTKIRITLTLSKEFFDLLQQDAVSLTKSAKEDGVELADGTPLKYDTKALIQIRIIDFLKNHMEYELNDLRERMKNEKRN